ncbi:MCE family protein [Nocardioides zeae]|uniref:MCE family protein n=1 Tax=Nocardioides imazamoxiresistens TaxID=3231893 RepID=A0ABU3PTB0_9ACTN|nr:MCE family protein [Nocardioides zeae]MDT9592480.1 MCE family protein [Nocardioides zeae]
MSRFSLANANRYRVGLAGFAVLAFLAALVGAAAGLSLGKSTYSAMLESTGGLRVGEEVQIAGVSAGDITGIELDGQAVRVTFTVDSDVELGDATTAEVKVATLLGTHFLLVTPAGEGDLSDDTIPTAQTRVPYNLQDAIDDAVGDLDEFDTQTLEASLAEFTAVLDASGDEIGPALDGVQALSEVVVQRTGQLDELLVAARGVTQQLTESAPDLIELMEQGTLILDTLRVRRDTISELLSDLTTLGNELSGVIEDNEEAVGPLLAELDVTIGVLQRHEATLDEALTMLPATARYFTNSSGTGPWLAQYAPGALPDNLECVIERRCAG